MSPRPTATTHAVLGLLSIRAWTAYELANQVERSLGWFWPRTPRKIYDEARRLAADGLAEGVEGATGRRPMTTYRITDAGRATLAQWLSEPSSPSRWESEAMVRVFFADGGDLDDLRRTLHGTKDDADDRLAVLEAMIDNLIEPDYAFSGRTHLNALGLRFQLDHFATMRRWAEWALDVVDGWTSVQDANGWDWQGALDTPTPGE